MKKEPESKVTRGIKCRCCGTKLLIDSWYYRCSKCGAMWQIGELMS